MSKFISRLNPPTLLLYLFVLIGQLANGIYQGSQVAPPALFVFIYALGFVWIMGWWLIQDSRKQALPMFYDLGLFLYLAWPIVLPYYLFKTRGARGLIAIISFIGVYIVAFVAGVALYVLALSQSN